MEDIEVGRRISDEVELRAFYDEVFDEVYRYASRLTGPDRAAAEDLVQDAFIALVRALRDGTATDLGIGWLNTVVCNRFLDTIRRRRTAQATP